MERLNEKRTLQEAMLSYFGNVKMTKQKEFSNFSVYYAKVGCLLCVENRYLVAIVKSDDKIIGYSTQLSNLDWDSFQTRTFDKILTIDNLKIQQLHASTSPNILSSRITKISETNDKTIYTSYEIPVQIELIKDDETDNHSDNGTIKSALDTFYCVVSFVF